MANLTETASYTTAIYQIATSDAVIGGPGGIANVQAQQLANRTAWLYQQVQSLMTAGASGAASITSGTINGAVIGGSTPAAGTFTALTATSVSVSGTLTAGGVSATTLSCGNVTITGGTINATPIGGSTPSTGVFTTLSAVSGAFTSGITVPTKSPGDSSQAAASTAFVAALNTNPNVRSASDTVTPHTGTINSTTTSYTPNYATSNNHEVTITQAGTINNPSNMPAGGVINFCIIMSGSGGFAVSWGTAYDASQISLNSTGRTLVSGYMDSSGVCKLVGGPSAAGASLAASNVWSGAQASKVAYGTASGAVALNLGALSSSTGVTWTGTPPASSNKIVLTASAAITGITLGNGADGTTYELVLVGGTGAPALVSPSGSNTDYGSPGSPTPTATAGKINVYSMEYFASIGSGTFVIAGRPG